jgi:DNA-binding FrmR family transcriptional regulator
MFKYENILLPLWVYGGFILRKCMDSDNLHRRLKKVIGQVNAIDRMIDEDIPCEDILMQVNASKSALHKIGQIILEGHIKHCVKEGIEKGDSEKTIQDFTKAIEYFSRL